ncbi:MULTISPECIES: hypothetical protein [pseudomallei group]|uniref:hypothetical protein n=1 Tax=pseudomallei group TaxID=111527 RepID=UPI00014F9561|nr:MULTISPECIES: hypothetical protein [pseudomallei group]EBA46198.1 hypothetical protein BURPS305_1645 [Burkholderia pseudomallei 305]
MPKKLALATRPAVAVDRPNSRLMEPSTKVIVPRSTESKKNAIAMITKMSLWYPENGNRSRRAAALARAARDGTAGAAGMAVSGRKAAPRGMRGAWLAQ